jgi:hypothetical protein
MRTSRIFLLFLFAGLLACGTAHAAKRSNKPAQTAARDSGQIVCNVRGCRPVKQGCHLEIIGAFTEEVCR